MRAVVLESKVMPLSTVVAAAAAAGESATGILAGALILVIVRVERAGKDQTQRWYVNEEGETSRTQIWIPQSARQGYQKVRAEMRSPMATQTNTHNCYSQYTRKGRQPLDTVYHQGRER